MVPTRPTHRHRVVPSPRTVGVWAWIAVVFAASVWLALWAVEIGNPDASNPMVIASPIMFSGLGAVVVTRTGGSRVGSLFLVMGAWILVGQWGILHLESRGSGASGLGDAIAVVLANVSTFVGVLIPLFLVMHLFPTDDLPSPRWRWVYGAAAIAFVTAVFSELFAAEVTWNHPSVTNVIDNPIGFLDDGGMGAAWAAPILGATFLPLFVSGIAALIVRYRRSEADVRAQVRWVVYAFGLFVLFGAAPMLFLAYYGWVALAGVMVVPIAMTIAITRYRLYEIDRLISRTLGYAIVTGILGLLFAAGSVWLPSLVVVDDSEFFVAGSTLAVAATFNPIRRRILRLVDRRFHRTKYDTEVVIHDFLRSVSGRVDIDGLVSEAVALVSEAMQPVSIDAWIPDEVPSTPEVGAAVRS